MVYLDYNATTPVDLRVIQALQPWFSEKFGNPSSVDYGFGWDAADAVAQAREQVALLINAYPSEIIFTSGATESINIVLNSGGPVGVDGAREIVTGRSEHKAVLDVCAVKENYFQSQVTYLGANRFGNPVAQNLGDSFSTSRPAILVLMLANNEIGTINNGVELAGLRRAADSLFFSDITQAVGKMSVDVKALGIDLAAFSAHKIYGPKGVGALFIRSVEPEIKLQPLIVGGGQERGLRGGTLNVPGIVGFGEACRIAKEDMGTDVPRMQRLRDKLEAALFADLPDIWVNGDVENRLCNTSNIGFRGVDARTLIRDMHDIACSTKSACSSGDPGPSHVLKAIGLTDEEAYSCIRFSLGRFTTEAEIDYAIGKIIGSVRKLRKHLPQRS